MFLQKLTDAINNFQLRVALHLSDEIRDAESNGYDISPAEDILWEKLTEMIELSR